MMKKLASSGLALGLAFGAGTAALADTTETAQGELSTKLNAALQNGQLPSNQELQTLAESNNWTAEDLQIWAVANRVAETDLQEWAEESGWSEEESDSLNLDVVPSIELDDLLNGSSSDEDDDHDDSLLGDDLLGGIL